MPVYFFTYHAYLSWLPDHKKGYTDRRRGVMPPDPRQADRYRNRASEDPILFGDAIQQAAIDELIIACEKQGLKLHGIATEPTHIHALVSWEGTKTWQRARAGLRTSLTLRFKKDFGDRSYFVDNSSRRRVKGRDHFNYLITDYIPKHTGWKWLKAKGKFL